MSVPRSITEILREHVTLAVECIDRMYLNVYVPRLQSERGVAGFFRYHRGYPFASSALMEPISKAFTRSIETFATREGIPLLTFAKGSGLELCISPRSASLDGPAARQCERASRAGTLGEARNEDTRDTASRSLGG